MKKSKKYIVWAGLIALLFGAYLIIDSLLFDGIKPRVVNENGIQANYFAKDNTEKKAAVILLGGGQWGDYWGQEFAERGFVGLSLPYTGIKGLPKSLEEIRLEYFEKTLEWLKKQPEVDPDKIIVMGASRNAELALVIASKFPELIHGVIAYAPSSVSWSNTVLPYNSNELKPSWTYQGVDIPYIPMDKIPGNESNSIKTIEYWKSGLENPDYLSKALIEVEKINGPILLFSGEDDMVWPSSLMADMIEKRIKNNNFKFSFQSIKYENAGHLISSNPESKSESRTGVINVHGKDYEYSYGGTNGGDNKAKQDAKNKVFSFIKKL